MNTLTKLALGLMGQWPTRAAIGDGATAIELPAPDLQGGRPLMQALARRRAATVPLPLGGPGWLRVALEPR